jgi:hypothetical protein
MVPLALSPARAGMAVQVLHANGIVGGRNDCIPPPRAGEHAAGKRLTPR